MKLEGGCYCGQVRYAAEGEPMMKAQCHCRECQYISRGSPNMFMLMPPDGFGYTKGMPKQFSRSDLKNAVTREFCAECGTHLVTRRPGLPAVILKVGTLDDPAHFGAPADGDIHRRQAGFPTNPRGIAKLRATAAAVARSGYISLFGVINATVGK
jgi:hypothetical protein